MKRPVLKKFLELQGWDVTITTYLYEIRKAPNKKQAILQDVPGTIPVTSSKYCFIQKMAYQVLG